MKTQFTFRQLSAAVRVADLKLSALFDSCSDPRVTEFMQKEKAYRDARVAFETMLEQEPDLLVTMEKVS